MTLEEDIKDKCRQDFAACWELAGNPQVSLPLFLWLKENYEVLCEQRWGFGERHSELLWSLDDVGYRTAYLEDAMWSNPLMPSKELSDEADLADDPQRIKSILKNPSCPAWIKKRVSQIQFDDRDWMEEVTEDEVDELKSLALSLLSNSDV